MTDAQATTYDEIPYSTTPFYYSHPDALATKGMIFGLTPAPPDRCRVLELGCARGGNLLPMAQVLLQSQFVGVDLSPGQIADARAIAATLGLRNIELMVRSILDIDESFGTFDYIICHGVFSWVPAEVQDRILTICKRNLAPNGIAYISYNTYPGWHLRGVLRDMLGFHVRRFVEPRVRLNEARAFLNSLGGVVEGATNVYGRLLAEEITELRPQADSYVFHEHLEDINQPLYFHQFMERATAKGLQFLDEAQCSPLPATVSPQVKSMLQDLATDLIAQEQYRDFLSGRSFRRTLLCHEGVAIRRPPSSDVVQRLHVVTRLRPTVPTWDPSPNLVREFATAKGATMSTNNPLLGKALYTLFDAWPRSLAFEDLWTRVRGASPEAESTEPNQLAVPVVMCYLADLIELHVHPPAFTLEVSDRPCASGFARLQAEDNDRVTNLRHYSVDLDAFDRLVLQHLDGSHDRTRILEALEDAVRAGELVIEQENQPLGDAETRRHVLGNALDSSLRRLSGNALLIA
jgi:methyltransferase-like protein/SAM-dependent methyltransferase